MFKLFQAMMEEDRKRRERGEPEPPRTKNLKKSWHEFTEAYQEGPEEERQIINDAATELLSWFLTDEDVEDMTRKSRRTEVLKNNLFPAPPPTQEPEEIQRAKARAEKLKKLPELEEHLRGLDMSEEEIRRIVERARLEILDGE